MAGGGRNVTYGELELNAKIKLKEKPDDEQRAYRMAEYTVVAKYPSMCMVEDKKGRRRGAAMGELVMNKVIRQERHLEALRRETGKPRGRNCKNKEKQDSGTKAGKT